MPTTPRGIWTPADSDDWDLTVDWAANAVSIDTAITNAVAEARPADTGWVNINSLIVSGFTGTVIIRKVGNVVELRANFTTALPSSSSSTDILSGLPSEYRPVGWNAWGSLYGNAFAGSLFVRPGGTVGVANRTGTAWGSFQGSVLYLV